ncbi:hypothetical protein QL285_033794 [Trifolium repens]|nr:hypothetical protein QL285_033794 [Trifolium repens]
MLLQIWMILIIIVEDGFESLKNNMSPTFNTLCLTKSHHSLDMYLSFLFLLVVIILQVKAVKDRPFLLICRSIFFWLSFIASLDIFFGKCYN